MRIAAALMIALAAAPPARAGEIRVTNEKDDTISVIDVDSLEVARKIDVGERPRGSPSTRTSPGPMSAPRTATRCR